MYYLDKVEVKIAFNQDVSVLLEKPEAGYVKKKKKSPNYPITGVSF